MTHGEYLDVLNAPFVAQLTAVTTSGGVNYYSWTEQAFDPATGTLQAASPGRSGTATVAPCVELNNAALSVPTYAWIRLRGSVNGGPWYELYAGAGSGGSSVGGVNLQTTSYTLVSSDNTKLVSFSSSGALTATLTAATTLGSTWFADVENRGTGTLTVQPASGSIDGGMNLSLVQNQGLRVFSDGSNFYTGRGYTSLGIAGNSTLFTGAIKLEGSTWVQLNNDQPNNAVQIQTTQPTNTRQMVPLTSNALFAGANSQTEILSLTVSVAGTYLIMYHASFEVGPGSTAGTVTAGFVLGLNVFTNPLASSTSVSELIGSGAAVSASASGSLVQTLSAGTNLNLYAFIGNLSPSTAAGEVYGTSSGSGDAGDTCITIVRIT